MPLPEVNKEKFSSDAAVHTSVWRTPRVSTASPAAASPAWNPWWANWLLVGVSSLVVLVLLEFTLRWLPIPFVERVRARQQVNQRKQEIHPKHLYVLNSEIGWTLTPHFTSRFVKKNFDILVEANSDGIRDHEYGRKEAGTVRILGLGDSFAFGWGVENEEGFYKVLEKKLNEELSAISHQPSAKAESREPKVDRLDEPLIVDARLSDRAESGKLMADSYEVINAGIPGFGTYEALNLLKSLGLGYDPDLVILAFYEGNDYKNNGQAPRRRVIRDGYLANAPTERSAVKEFLLDHSVLATVVDACFSSLRKKSAFPENVEKTKQYLLEMKSLLDKKDIPLLVIFIPDQDAAVYTRSGLLRRYDRFVGGMDLSQVWVAVETFCRENDITYYRLSGRFENTEESAELRLEDTHFNARGHEVAADEIFQFLQFHTLKERAAQ